MGFRCLIQRARRLVVLVTVIITTVGPMVSIVVRTIRLWPVVRGEVSSLGQLGIMDRFVYFEDLHLFLGEVSTLGQLGMVVRLVYFEGLHLFLKLGDLSF